MGVQYQQGDLAVSLLRSGQPIRLRAGGWSMKPLLPPGCILRIVPLVGELRVGDIVLYQGKDGKLVSHRILTYAPDSIRTKGDACTQPDGVIDSSQILGRVVGVEHPIPLSLEGSFARWMGRFVGFVFPLLVRLKMGLMRSVNGLNPEGASDG